VEKWDDRYKSQSSFLFKSEAQHGNPIDRSFGGVFARWWGLGIPSLAQLARSQDERVTTLPDPICGIDEGSSTLGRTRDLFQVSLNQVSPPEVFCF
jgi:hypothetical protein